ncbi:Ppx/GppA phosphatase [Thermovirga lienii DSM 17291]|uniref:Ppx/GppA phosphatase n=1 Tax=Thermovirga lienii (strain ATCC BAA-1197 / DSM 17291 / Cas60314) TaxID=580340 RepID=G7V8B2_THELD|nr:Ppx/GppA phosphatase [Thermovirga lienii]AER66274.1 Ppx/GppA phosphatase [Thermovirga lienii DSM 17291]HCD71751.1 phosphatase [Thermovirga lienii]
MDVNLGAVDLGSNSLRCLVVGYAKKRLTYRASGLWITRITEGIGSGSFVAEGRAVDRTMAAVREALKMLDAFGVEKSMTKVFATESLRAAGNGHSIKMMIEQLCALPVDILSPSEEAYLSRKGALLGLGGHDVVFDLGGGSLELSGEDFAHSFPLGAVRMTGLYGEDWKKIKDAVKIALAGAKIHGKKLAGVGGTSSNLAMMAKGLPNSEYHPSKIHGCKISLEYLALTRQRLKSLSVDERKNVLGLERGREDIIIAGISVIEALLESLNLKEYTHSETDLLWAQCAAMAESRGLEVEGIVL